MRPSNPLALALLVTTLTAPAGRAAAVSYSIEVQSGGPGSVSPSGFVDVLAGGSQTFTFTPDGCNVVRDVQVDEVSVGVGLTQYTFTNVQGDHVLYVLFGLRATATTLQISPAVGECAVPETLTAVVAPLPDGGVVNFYDGDQLLGTGSPGQPFLLAGLTVGPHMLTAYYSGTSCSFPSFSSDVHYDVAETGSIPVTLDVRPVHGQCALPDTLTATVGSRYGGTVQFFDGTTPLGTSTVVGGKAKLITWLAAGSRSCSASFLGAGCAVPIGSPLVGIDVAETDPTSMTLELALDNMHNPSWDVTCSTTLRIDGHVADTNGNVTLYEGATVLGTAPMTHGQSLQDIIVFPNYGTHTLSAVVQLDPCISTIASPAESVEVNDDRNFTTARLKVTPAQADAGQSVLLQAVLDWPNVFGTVHFFDVTNDPVEIGSVQASFSVAQLAHGPIASSRSFQARFDGNTAYQPCNSNVVYLQIGPPGPPPTLFSPPWKFGSREAAISSVVADFNADGYPDMATANHTRSSNDWDHNVSVLKGDVAGQLTFTVHRPVVCAPPQGVNDGPCTPTSIAIADLNADGKVDFVAAFPGGVSVALGTGDGMFVQGVNYAAGKGPNSVAIGDLDGDGRPDLAVANTLSNNVSVLLGHGDGTFASPVDYMTGIHPHAVAIADLNGDGHLDLAVADDAVSGTPGGEVWILLGNGDGTLSYGAPYATGQSPVSVAIADLNADGRLDVVTANFGELGFGNTVSVLLGNGDGTLGPRTDVRTESGSCSVAIADLNGDSRPDLAVAVGSGVSVLVGNGNGTFQPRTDYRSGFNAHSVAIANMNSDGLPDLTVVGDFDAQGFNGAVFYNTNAPVATLIARFDAISGPDGTELRWSFGDASRVASAIVERAEGAAGPWEPIALDLRRDGDVTAAIDHAADPSRAYFYRLDVKLVDGSSVTFGPVASTASASIGESAMNAVEPNPARGVSQIEYAVARAGHVRLEVADVGGRVVATLFDGTQRPGHFRAAWDGTSRGERLPAGLYFVRLTTLDRTVSKKITRLR